MTPTGRSALKRLLRRLGYERAIERIESMTFEDTGFGYDPFGFERESLLLAYAFLVHVYRRWFRVISSGHEHIPREGGAILAGNHSGLLPWDAMMLAIDVMERVDPPRPIRAIVDHFAFRFPYVGLFMFRTGQVPGTPRNFADLLDRQQLVLVFPEGTRAIVKPYKERYQLKPFNVGFIEMAVAKQVPVVPFAVVGAEEQAPVLFGSKRLGRKLGLPILPVTPTFPLLGPLGLLPYPVRYEILYGEPLDLAARYTPEDVRDPDRLRAIAAEVQGEVAGLVRRGLDNRARRGRALEVQRRTRVLEARDA